MEIIEINRNTLQKLWDQHPESLSELSMNDNFLVFRGEKVDISQFNINDLIENNAKFRGSIDLLSSEDIFRIVRLHALSIKSVDKEKNAEETAFENIKKSNPYMKNVTIIVKKTPYGEKEYINIVDSTGKDHLFFKDRDFNFMSAYEYGH